MSDQTETVDSENHGISYSLLSVSTLHTKAVQFFCTETPDKPRPDAWCRKCEDMVNADGGWNEENEKIAQITLLCEKCYDEAKERNIDQIIS